MPIKAALNPECAQLIAHLITYGMFGARVALASAAHIEELLTRIASSAASAFGRQRTWARVTHVRAVLVGEGIHLEIVVVVK